MTAQQIYLEIMECRTKQELNHVITKHEEAIMEHKWLHEILKDAIKRIAIVREAKKMYA